MRSTRQKLKLLRGISRANTNGGNTLTSRKSSNGNSYNGCIQANGASPNANGNLIHDQKTHKHQSHALAQHNSQFYDNSANSSSNSTSASGSRHHRYQSKSHASSTVSRSGAVCSQSSASFSTVSTSNLNPSQQQAGQEKSSLPNNTRTLTGGNAVSADSQPQNKSNISSSIGVGNPQRQWTQFLATNMDCTGLNSDIRQKAFGICRDYLHGAWKQIDSKDLIIKRVSGGLSNWLYHCSLPLSLTPQHNEPTQVLLRFYGQVHGEGALESLITESVIFTLLSERKLGPRLYGVFPGGRVEEFIPARPLLTGELRDPDLSLLIAQKTAQIHGLNIPISKEPSWLWGTLDRWMANVRECFTKSPSAVDCKPEIFRQLLDYNLEGELMWLKEFLPQVNSPVVFAHNDLQEGNILIRPEFETPDDKLALIDFEYCSYNYRGFDLANHFCEWSFNNNVEEYPNFAFTPGDLPSVEEKLRFIRRYVQVLREETRMNFAETDYDALEASGLLNEEHIMKEIQAFTLASHFFWSLWGIVNAQVSKIPFGYWEYGLCRLEIYFMLKKAFV